MERVLDWTYEEEIEKKYKLVINLQLFADGEKTEEATPKRRDEARKKGQVPKSMDIPQAATLLVGMIILNMMMSFYYDVFCKEFIRSFKDSMVKDLSIEKVWEIMANNISVFFIVSGPVLAGVLVAGILSNYLQVGILFTLEPLKPTFDKINPLNGLKNLFSFKKVVEIIKTIIKLSIISFYAYIVIKGSYDDLLKIPYMGFLESFILVFKLSYDIVLKIIFVLFIIAVMDYFYQRYEFEKSLKMSKEEIKQEYKQSEGDPQIKARMRQMQRSMIRKRMMQDVPKATVVITNPTHLSIAIQYEPGMQAPVVLAKGADNIAMRIRELAAEHNIPLVENKPLAQALYKYVEIEDEIPEQYYQSVAEVLKYVYKLKNKR